MTTGIYALYWAEQDLIYIGQSQNIERRFTEHLNKMKLDVHVNYRIQSAYNKFGQPELQILQKCFICDLNKYENIWINEFNSVNTGLNISDIGSSTKAANSKYSKMQILKVFALLLRVNLTLENISSRTKVNISTIKAIRAGNKHAWLAEEYPVKYSSMLSIDRISVNNGMKSLSYIMISPKGEEYITDNIKEFCKTDKLLSVNITSAYSILNRVLNNSQRAKTYKGWRIKYL